MIKTKYRVIDVLSSLSSTISAAFTISSTPAMSSSAADLSCYKWPYLVLPGCFFIPIELLERRLVIGERQTCLFLPLSHAHNKRSSYQIDTTDCSNMAKLLTQHTCYILHAGWTTCTTAARVAINPHSQQFVTLYDVRMYDVRMYVVCVYIHVCTCTSHSHKTHHLMLTRSCNTTMKTVECFLSHCTVIWTLDY